MPELPEVETIRRGLLLHCKGNKVLGVKIRRFDLRWPIPKDLPKLMAGQTLLDIKRRSKYLLFEFETGTLLVHLGMSGCLKLVDQDLILKHDHYDIQFENLVLRYNDPRRFGAALWIEGYAENHPLLAKLGPEPLSDDFNAISFYQKIKTRKSPLKLTLMNNEVVVGVGNIYANESLFLAGIHPETLAAQLSKQQCQKLVPIVKQVIQKAIEAGGTTLKDYKNLEGKPGYFQQALYVYGRKQKPCLNCKTILQEIRLSGRSTVFCPQCQIL